MKRIIKFRCWDSDNIIMIEMKALFFDMEYRKSLTIMQFTGLTDKNGKEIYEGDIIDCTGTKYICEWNEHRAEYAWKTLKGNYVYPIGDCRTQLEVIGNIYEQRN